MKKQKDVGLPLMIVEMIKFNRSPCWRWLVVSAEVEHVFEISKGTFDFREFLVETHGFDRRQIRLFDLDNIFAFVSLLTDKMHGILEEGGRDCA